MIIMSEFVRHGYGGADQQSGSDRDRDREPASPAVSGLNKLFEQMEEAEIDKNKRKKKKKHGK